MFNKNEKKYTLNSNSGKKYKFILSLNKYNIEFLFIHNDRIFISKYLYEITQISQNIRNNNLKTNQIKFDTFKMNNQYFSNFNTLTELYNELILQINRTLPELSEQQSYFGERILLLKIYLPNSKFTELNLTIPEIIKNDQEKFEELYNVISKLHQRIDFLEMANSKLEKDFRNLENLFLQKSKDSFNSNTKSFENGIGKIKNSDISKNKSKNIFNELKKRINELGYNNQKDEYLLKILIDNDNQIELAIERFLMDNP